MSPVQAEFEAEEIRLKGMKDDMFKKEVEINAVSEPPRDLPGH